jgi:hypothetical protein
MAPDRTLATKGQATRCRVLVPVRDYEALEKTAEIHSGEDTLAAIRRGLDDPAAGRSARSTGSGPNMAPTPLGGSSLPYPHRAPDTGGARLPARKPCGPYPLCGPRSPEGRPCQRAVQRGQIRGGAVGSPFLALAETAVVGMSVGRPRSSVRVLVVCRSTGRHSAIILEPAAADKPARRSCNPDTRQWLR